jgi:hypothetical protein
MVAGETERGGVTSVDLGRWFKVSRLVSYRVGPFQRDYHRGNHDTSRCTTLSSTWDEADARYAHTCCVIRHAVLACLSLRSETKRSKRPAHRHSCLLMHPSASFPRDLLPCLRIVLSCTGERALVRGPERSLISIRNPC